MIRRPASLLSIALLAGGCLSPGGGPEATAPGATGTTARPAATTKPAPPNLPQAAVLRVFDGDTLLVSLEGGEEEVRLLGINAPEDDECFGEEAGSGLAAFVAAGTVRLDIAAERDQYGRLLAYAYSGALLVNEALLADGFAVALHEDHTYAAAFQAAAAQARAGSRGLWAPAACGTPETASVILAAVEANPPGPDEDDLNGEWVLLENTGSAAADLGGWVLRDESSVNRYPFPSGTLLGAGETLIVSTGCGPDDAGSLHWCAPGPVWNNGGDTALLLDPQGNVAAFLAYP